MSEIHHLKVKATYQPIHCVAEGEPITCWETGGYCGDKRLTHNLDLFLLSEVKECWVNVYHDAIKDKVCIGGTYTSESLAKSTISARNNSTYIKTIRITNEPE